MANDQTMRTLVRDTGGCAGNGVVCRSTAVCGRERHKSGGGRESRDGVQRRMRGSYGYSVSRNTGKPTCG